MMARKSQYISISTILGIVLQTYVLLHPVAGQSQQQSSSSLSQPVSLAHLYWHFLSYQHHLDTLAAVQVVQGNNGTSLSGALQAQLGFSDTDFAYIRTSSVRLTTEVQALSSQAAAIQAAGLSLTSQTQLSALASQREADISAEISYLQQNLSPAEIATLQTFLYQFLFQTGTTGQTSSTAVQSSPAAVQQ